MEDISHKRRSVSSDFLKIVKVRTIAILEHGIVTGSRDRTVKVWIEGSSGYEPSSSLVGHSDFVTSLAASPAGSLQQIPNEVVLSGSRDLHVILWDLETASPRYLLKGHKYQVSCVAVGKQNNIISTSHDGTIRVYSGIEFSDVLVLEGHTSAIQTVLVLADGSFLSGSSDATIKLWVENRCRHTFTGHTDTVRSLALLSDVGVVSASHDTTLKLWDFEGNVLVDFVGHKALVFAAATSSTGLIASASEDNSAKVWDAAGSCLATIPHPGCVWDVAFLPNSDLVTGCSDNSARVFTSETSREGAQSLQEAYQASLVSRQQEAGSSSAAEAAATELPPDLKLEEPTALLQPGKSNGAIKVIREDGGGSAYSWNSSQGTWEKLGQIVGAPGGGSMEVGSSSMDGVRYDQVISVDVGDDVAPLRLGVNRGDNPYHLADSFLAKHNLPTSYREQIVDFVVKNTGGLVSLPPGPSLNVDPFTGSGAYVPGASPRYPPPGQLGGAPPPASLTGGGVDPFTGSRSARQPIHIPATTMLIFDSLPNAAAVGTKILSLSQTLAASPDMAHMALSEQEKASGALETLVACAASSGAAAAKPPSEAEVQLLEKLLRWPASALFPVLDLVRMLLLQEKVAAHLASAAGPLELSPLGTLGAALATACAEPQVAANQQTGLRLLCNAFKSPSLRTWLDRQVAALLEGFSPAWAAPQKAVRAAAAAFLLNLAIHSRAQALPPDTLAQAVSAIAALLAAASDSDDEATSYRSAAAIGTIASGSKDAKQLARDLDADQSLQVLAKRAEPKISQAAQEALTAIRQ